MKIKDWNKFQHFRDRRPPWIKLYRDIMDDMDWHELDPLAAKHLVMLWLLASEFDGNLPPMKTIAFRLRCSENQAKSTVSKLSKWLEQDDIAQISSRHQGDSPEKEGEGEVETEKEGEKEVKAKVDDCFIRPDDCPEQAWNDWMAARKAKRLPNTPTAWAGFMREVERARTTVSLAIQTCAERGWGGFRADWESKGRAGKINMDDEMEAFKAMVRSQEKDITNG